MFTGPLSLPLYSSTSSCSSSAHGLIVEYFYNVYEQQYFGSFDPVFLVAVLMAASAYGFMRIVSTVRTSLRPTRMTKKNEDDY